MTYSETHNITIPSHPRGRRRYVGQQWVRDVNGPVLPKPPPLGVRTPNGLIWGHDLTDFMWIQQLHDVDVFTVWSRSMIKEFGENYDATEWEEEDKKQVPRRRSPWPVLKLPKAIMDLNIHGTDIGVIPEGCKKHRRSDYSPKYRVDEDVAIVSSKEITTYTLPEVSAILEGIFPTLGNDEGLMIANDGENRLKNSRGLPYTLLWADHVRVSFKIFALEKLPSGIHGLDTFLDVAYDHLGRDFTSQKSMLLADTIGLVDMGGLLNNSIKMIATTQRASTSSRAGPSSQVVSSAKPTLTLKEKFMKSPSFPSSSGTDPGKGSAKGLQSSLLSQELSVNSRFSVKDIPKLEETLPRAFMPDVVIVHDPHYITLNGGPNDDVKRSRTLKYARVLPKYPFEVKAPFLEAHLYLHEQNRMGTGSHSAIYRAPFTLPPPLSAHSRNGNVTVAAKLSFANLSDRRLLNNEGAMYSKFPRHLMEDWCGYNFVPPIKHPVPVGPVVPKFYGYYLPEGLSIDDALNCDLPSPILLMEDCGKPVEPEKLTLDQQSECFSLIHRFHKADFLQGSPYLRNMVVQPGPLTAPPSERSKKTPSFRLIDFGRGQDWQTFHGTSQSEEHLKAACRNWSVRCQLEAGHARDDLEVPAYEY